jgi:hypothetical protein
VLRVLAAESVERGCQSKALSLGDSAKLVAARLLQEYSTRAASNINALANQRADGQAKYLDILVSRWKAQVLVEKCKCQNSVSFGAG